MRKEICLFECLNWKPPHYWYVQTWVKSYHFHSYAVEISRNPEKFNVFGGCMHTIFRCISRNENVKPSVKHSSASGASLAVTKRVTFPITTTVCVWPPKWLFPLFRPHMPAKIKSQFRRPFEIYIGKMPWLNRSDESISGYPFITWNVKFLQFW